MRSLLLKYARNIQRTLLKQLATTTRQIKNIYHAHTRTGASGERTAQRFLRKKGYYLRHVNWRCSIGEFDIVAQDRSTLVFVEVKSRNKNIATAFSPERAVDQAKQTKLRKLADWYWRDFNHELSYRRIRRCRFDVVAITESPDKFFRKSKIRHHQNFF